MNRDRPLKRAIPLLTALAIAYLCFITFRVDYGAVEPGLDQSWMWAINAIRQTGYVFGTDAVFTWGPLGFLLRPRAISNNLQWAAFFTVGIQLVFAGALAVIARMEDRPGGLFPFLGGLAFAFLLGLRDETFCILLIFLCLTAACAAGLADVTFCILTGVLAALFLFVKFSIGIAAIAVIGVWIALALWKRPGDLPRYLAIGLSFLGTTTVATVLCFHGVSAFGNWLRLSWNVASGYGAAMSVAGPAWEAVAGIALFALLLFTIGFSSSRTREGLLVLLIPTLITFKHGYVGFTSMVSDYFTYMAALASMPLLYARTRADFRLTTVLLVPAICLAAIKGFFFIADPTLTASRTVHLLTGQTAIENLLAVAQPATLKERLQREEEQHLAAQRLPARWVDRMASLPGGVDVMPWELTYLPANHLRWQPSLVLQSYSAYTHELDAATAERFRKGEGPETLLVDYTGLFGRNVVLDNPDIFAELLSSFSVAGTDRFRNLLWIHRTSPRPFDPSPRRQSAKFSLGQWVDLPAHDGTLFASFRLHPNFSGLVRQYLWKTSPVLLRLQYRSGKLAEFRMLPATASGRILLNYFPASLQDLRDLFEGIAFDRVTRFQITGPGTVSFQQQADVDWVLDSRHVRDFGTQPDTGSPQIQLTHPAAHQVETLSITAKDPKGYRDIRFLDLHIGPDCSLRYDANVHWVRLDGHAGSPGSAEILANAACSVNLLDSWVEEHAQNTTLHLALAAVAAGSKRITASLETQEGETAPAEPVIWDTTGTAIVADPWQLPPTPPFLAAGGDLTGLGSYHFRLRLSAPNGIATLREAEIIVNSLQEDWTGCNFSYDHGSSQITLLNSSGTRSTVALGSGGKVQNQFCEIAAPRIAASDPYSLLLEMDLRLDPKMLHKTTVYGYARTRNGLWQNWHALALLPESR